MPKPRRNTDKDRIDFLQRTKKSLYQWETITQGWSVFDSNNRKRFKTARKAIDAAMLESRKVSDA